jgi:hypothetical protein
VEVREPVGMKLWLDLGVNPRRQVASHAWQPSQLIPLVMLAASHHDSCFEQT